MSTDAGVLQWLYAETLCASNTGTVTKVEVDPGLAGWDEPEARVNVGHTVYEEVVTFYLNRADEEPQPLPG